MLIHFGSFKLQFVNSILLHNLRIEPKKGVLNKTPSSWVLSGIRTHDIQNHNLTL